MFTAFFVASFNFRTRTFFFKDSFAPLSSSRECGFFCICVYFCLCTPSHHVQWHLSRSCELAARALCPHTEQKSRTTFKINKTVLKLTRKCLLCGHLLAKDPPCSPVTVLGVNPGGGGGNFFIIETYLTTFVSIFFHLTNFWFNPVDALGVHRGPSMGSGYDHVSGHK